jgi:hypothetical protein
MTLAPVGTNTIHRLLKQATRAKAESTGIPEAIDLNEQQSHSSSAELNQLQFREILRLAQQVIAVRHDPFGLAPELLTYVSSQLHAITPLQGLVATLAPEPRFPSSPTVRLLAISQFSQSGVQITTGNAPMVRVYLQPSDELLSFDFLAL